MNFLGMSIARNGKCKSPMTRTSCKPSNPGFRATACTSYRTFAVADSDATNKRFALALGKGFRAREGTTMAQQTNKKTEDESN